jgi:heptosyltransferase-1
MDILIVKTSSLGDIVHSFPVVAYLKRRFPECNIDWVVEEPFSELLLAHPDIRRVIACNTKQWRKNLFQMSAWKDFLKFRKDLQREDYDLIVDLQGNSKSGLMTFLSIGDIKLGYGFKAVPEWPNLLVTNRKVNPFQQENIREEYLSIVKGFFNDKSSSFEEGPVTLRTSESNQLRIGKILSHKKLDNRQRVMVCPGANWVSKQVPVDLLKGVLTKIADERPTAFLFLWGTEDEYKKAISLYDAFSQTSVVLEKLSLPVLQSLMARMDLVVAMDSLPLHLAGTTGVPTMSFFGPSMAKRYKPMGDRHVAYQGGCPYGKSFNSRCPILRSCHKPLCISDLQQR